MERGADVNYKFHVLLEDLYVGFTQELIITRNVICRHCSLFTREDSSSGCLIMCAVCQGRGSVRTIRHIGPSSMPTWIQLCPECEGTGEVDPDDSCVHCHGQKVVPEEQELCLVVEKGSQDGQCITFPCLADESLDTAVPGDVVIWIEQSEHPRFTRKGDDLFYEHTLTETESLSGFRFVLTHLDGRKLLIKSRPGEVVAPDSYKVIDNEGMPVYDMPTMKGKLYIHFSVHPDLLVFENLVTELSVVEVDEDCEETTLCDVNFEEMQDRGSSSQQGGGFW